MKNTLLWLCAALCWLPLAYSQNSSEFIGTVTDPSGAPVPGAKVTVIEMATGLARSTVLTVMERLRKKRRLTRHRSGGVYLYASVEAPDDLLHGVVRTFVDTALSGSVSPFVNYLTESGRLSDAELAELEQLVAKLRSKGKNR